MRWLWPAVLGAWVGLASGCSSEPPRPNVVVLLVDALRADRLGCYGYERETSPRIDALASQSHLFTHAYAQSPWTKPSIPTLFTSLYPIQHKVYEGHAEGSADLLQSDTLSDDLLTVAEVLGGAGFRTLAFVNNAHLPADHGFAQGFEVYEQADFDAAEINRRFLEWIDGTGERPFFAYLHYLDVHWPFQPAPAFRDRFARSGQSALFDREDWIGLRDRINDGSVPVSESDRARLSALHDAGILELDQRIGELLDALRARDLLGETLILLTSDHGEELLEHGRVGHGGRLFEEVLRIPLMIRLPGAERGRREETPARLLDVFPTLLGAVGITPPERLEGRDLLARSDPPARIIAEARHKRTYRVSVRRGRWKYIRTYRAPGVRALAPDRPETFGLVPGMRVKAKGWFEQDGSLSARKVSVKDGSDEDFELSGPVSRIDRPSREFNVYGFRVLPMKQLRGPEGEAVLGMLEEGAWVKVEGHASTGMTLLADKLELLSPGDRQTELEGIIESIEPGSRDTAAARIGNVTVRLSGDTRIKGLTAAARDASTARWTPQDDPFTPERLRSEEGLVTEALLFDLGSDPGEQRDVASLAPARVEQLHRDLELWLERMARSSSVARGARKDLDEQQLEQLRHLGYVE